nr:protein YgfX [uncultured Alteromonas sp.]
MSQPVYRCLLAVAALGIIAVLASSLWSAGITGLVSVCLIVFWPLSGLHHPETWIVGESGEGYTLSVNGKGDSWQISPRSKLLPFALYLVRYCRQSQRSQSGWLFPWQVRDKDYRRLARIVFRQGQL